MKLKELEGLGLGKNLTVKISKCINKNGRLKGRNKKEEKRLKRMCTHHRLNKKGKIKPNIGNDGNGMCYCEACEKNFRAKAYNNDEVHSVINEFDELLQQSIFMASALDAGDETIEYLAALSLLTGEFSKTYKKIRHAAEKRDSIAKKTKNKTERWSGSSAFGGWSHK